MSYEDDFPPPIPTLPAFTSYPSRLVNVVPDEEEKEEVKEKEKRAAAANEREREVVKGEEAVGEMRKAGKLLGGLGLGGAMTKEERREKEAELKRAKGARRAEAEGKALGKKLGGMDLEK